MTDLEQNFWNELSAFEQEANILEEAERFHDWRNNLTYSQRWLERRRAELRVAKSFRAAFKEVQVEPFYDGIKRAQKRLLKLRIERATGIMPGHA